MDARGGDRDRFANHQVNVPAARDLSSTIAAICAEHRKRCYAMETRKRADLALGAALRGWLGWSRNCDKAEAEAIKTLAAELIVCGETLAKGKPHKLSASVGWTTYGVIIAMAIASRAPSDAVEKQATREMERLAKTLPVWAEFARDVRGFGALQLAVIVGEAGNLSNYATVARLWKRMGVAVIGGARQGAPGKGATAADWIVHGYNKRRRSRLFVLGDVLIKVNRDGAYRSLYLARKAFELSRAPEMTPMHAHRRAQRYMEKRLLRDLWRAWRRAVNIVVPSGMLPAAEFAEAAE